MLPVSHLPRWLFLTSALRWDLFIFLSNSCVAAERKKTEWFKLFFFRIGGITNLSERCSVRHSAGALKHRGYSNGAYELPWACQHYIGWDRCSPPKVWDMLLYFNWWKTIFLIDLNLNKLSRRNTKYFFPSSVALRSEHPVCSALGGPAPLLVVLLLLPVHRWMTLKTC